MRAKRLILTSFSALALVPAAKAAMVLGDTIGIDFGATASTDPNNTWNHLSVGGDATTPGLDDNGVDPNSVVISSLVNTDNVSVSAVTFTLTNNTDQIAWDFPGAGAVGASPFDHLTVSDAIISNDASGREVAAGTNFFTLTFANLDDSLTYNLAGGYDHNNTNQGFSALWTADGESFTTDGSNAGSGYGSLSGLSTDGSGNLVITVTGTATGASHVTVGALTLTAVPEPTSAILLGAGGILLLVRRNRRI